ncbi:MAG: glycosyltransferase family 1 protein [Cyclobacteriaceae bacterium]
MKVVFFHRKPRPNFNFSVENLFKQIRAFLPDEIDWEVKELSHFSNGFFKRFYITLEAAFNQKGINHITGDINFVALGLKKSRTVLTILDVGFMQHANPLARMILRYFWIVFPVKRSAIITTISEATRQELMKYVNVDPSRIKVVYVPISSAFKPEPKLFNKTEPTILQIGTKPNKNVIRLAQALKGLKCKLEIIGQINEALQKELDASGINYRASKNLSNEEMLEKYRNADILSFVSTYEGFGMPIVEANTMGRVVVTSNILSMPEVAGNAAHLVDPFDVNSIREGILKVIHDDTYRDKLIMNGFENRKRFDVDEIARQYTGIYRDLSRQ